MSSALILIIRYFPIYHPPEKLGLGLGLGLLGLLVKLVLQHATYISPVSLKTDLGHETEPEHATYILYHLYNL